MQSWQDLIENLKRRPPGARLLWLLLVLYTLAISFSISISEILLAGACVCYLYLKLRYNRRMPRLPVFLPLLVFSACTVVAAIFSIHPSVSLREMKGLVLFILIPLFYDTIEDIEDIRIIHKALIAAGVLSCIMGFYQFFTYKGEVISNRMSGFLGHWMTFSCVLMMLTVLLFSYLLFGRKHPIWLYPVFLFFCLTLVFSLTRNAWLGFLAAAFVLLAMKEPRWLPAIPAIVFLVFWGSVWLFPSIVSFRISNTFNIAELSTRDRIEMLKSGWRIIEDHPVTGVGGGVMPLIYPQYRSPAAIQIDRNHLHNNFVQIAAEYGLITLAAWLWLMGRILFDLLSLRKISHPEGKICVHAGIGVVVALLVAGMFEYNYGDSEVRMLFLVLAATPYFLFKQLPRLKSIDLTTTPV